MALNTVTDASDRVLIRNVLLSVSNKDGLGELVGGVLKHCPGARFYSTGGTYRAVEAILGEQAEQKLVSVERYTGQPELQGGLVKTLDYKVHLGLLSEEFNEDHQRDIERVGAVRFDLVAVNLYPFQEAIARADATPETARGNIDIGGPAMLRAAAKNYLRVAPVCDPALYGELVSELAAHSGATSLAFRYGLAARAFRHTADYDAAVAAYFAETEPATAAAAYRVR